MGDHTLAVQVPADDGSIQQAFAELDARLTAWLSAMKDAQHAMSVQAHQPAPPETVPAEPPVSATSEAPPSTPPSPSGATPPAPVDATQEAAGEPLAEAPPAAPAAEDAAASATAETRMEPEPQAPSAAKPAARRRSKGIVAITPPAAPEAAKASGPVGAFAVNAAAADDEERALMASLDEETRKAIKVMRRLNPSNKTLQQLLEEYEASKTGRSGEPNNRTSWWKRGK